MRTRTILATGLAAILLASGCTSKDGGTPTPTESSTGAADRYGAPPVTNQLKPDKYIANPCTALTAAQAQNFGEQPTGKPTTTGAVAETAGPWCGWKGEDRYIGVYFFVIDKNGLADLYRDRRNDAYFEPTTVDGYPAILRDTSDDRSSGLCAISVGVTDHLYFRAESQENIDDTLACGNAKKVAAAVITTMKEGA
jgi:hypothetical protein